MRPEVVNFLELWIADELLCKTASAETAAQVLARIEQCLYDPDVSQVVRKHSGKA